MKVSNLLIKIDKFSDYLPLSPITNLIDLFQKCVILPFMQKSTVQSSHYYKHLDQKSFTRCVLLMIPIIGNIIIGLYDYSKKIRNNPLPDVVKNTNPNNFHKIPTDDLFVHKIFPYLDLASLAKSCCVSKKWKQLASAPILWKTTIYNELAFSNKMWAKCFGADVVRDENNDEEFSSLPTNIREEYQKFKSAFPEKNAKDSLMLVRLPKTLNGGLTLKSLGSLAKRFFPNNEMGYRYIWDQIVTDLGDRPIDKSRWVLMTTDILPGSRNNPYAVQQQIVANLAKKSLIGYEVPETLEAATCILAQYFSSNKRLFNDSPWTCIRCKENIQGWQLVVGGFAPAGLIVSHNFLGRRKFGVAALRKF